MFHRHIDLCLILSLFQIRNTVSYLEQRKVFFMKYLFVVVLKNDNISILDLKSIVPTSGSSRNYGRYIKMCDV